MKLENSPYFSYNIAVESAYIITIKGHTASEKHSRECQFSCHKAGMPFKVWDAFDGTGDGITIPDHSIDDSFTKMIKVTDHYLTRGEVACAYSHISLWRHCALIDRPIVILEHDAIMKKKFETFNAYNTILYLGGQEWESLGWPQIDGIPPHASEGPNYHFICRAHAYAIDPAMAKNLLSHVLKMGICAPLDIMIRADLFNITHRGSYAFDKSYNKSSDTTIKARPMEGRKTDRNDDLSV